MKVPIRIVMSALLLVLSFVPTAQAQSTAVFTQLDFDRMFCGLSSEQQVVCTTRPFEPRFEVPADLPPATAVTTGETFACVLLVNGNIQCWGDTSFGLQEEPTSGAPYQAISAGDEHICAIDRDGALVCWGNPANDRLSAPEGSFTSLVSSYTDGCAVGTDTRVQCWGNRAAGHLDVPADLPPAKQIAMGRNTTCALLEDGSLQCWGFPIPLPTQGPYQAIAMDYSYSGSAAGLRGGFCALDFQGGVDCSFFNVNTGEVLNDLQLSVPTATGFVDIALVDSYACGIAADGTIRCWGGDSVFASSLDIPMINAVEDPVPATTNLRAEIYSGSTVELFWASPRTAYDVAGHEILRNGEVADFTTNLSSYLVDDLEPGTAVEFSVRQVSVDGRTGEASAAITIDTGDNSNLSEEAGSTYQTPVRPLAPAGLTAFVYSPTTLEIIWDRPERDYALQGYEIRRDGELIAFSPGPSYFDEVPDTDHVYRYDVIAIERSPEATIMGIGSIDVAVGSADAGVCR